MNAATWQVCSGCGTEIAANALQTRCQPCGGLLEVRHQRPEASGAGLRGLLDSRLGPGADTGPSGVWRFKELIHQAVPPGSVVSHPEGNTPLLFRPGLAEWAGIEGIRFKHEGHNPTASFKDRGMTVGVTQARWIGARAVACASTGNTAASMAAYAAQAGLPAFVLVPAGKIALGKLAQTLAYGARVLAVRGDFDACLRLVESASGRLGFYLLNSVNPFRLEGQKTIVLETLQQLGWSPPDWIVLPGGNLGNTAAFGKALREARELGLIERVPRLAVVQAEGAAPFARSYREGFATRYRVTAETVATAIRIGDPASFDRAVEAIRYTNGVVLTVTDGEILAAKQEIDGVGVGCEPASAASLAGARKLVAEGTIGRSEQVVAVLTGHLLKDPEILLSDEAKRRIAEIDASVEAIEKATKT